MRIIYFVTGNETKIRHAQTAMNKYDLAIIQKRLELIEPREEEPEQVAWEKVRQATKLIDGAVMVEDSGIFIRALNGFPKTMVKFATNTLGVGKILKLMEGETDRGVEFHQSIAFFEPPMKEPKVFSYIDAGFTIADKIWGGEGDDFDRILIPPGENKALITFSKEWRAERDLRQNSDNMHYVQLAKWLSQ